MKFACLLLIICGVQANLQSSLKHKFATRRYHNEIRDCTGSILLNVTKKHTVMRYYVSKIKKLFSYPSEINEDLRRKKQPLFFSSIDNIGFKKNMYFNAHLCVIETADEEELRLVMSQLYKYVHYANCIINLMFESHEGKNLEKFAKEIWNKGYPMNIRFLLFSKLTKNTWIIGPASYSPETCKEGRLIKFGHCSIGEEKLEQQALFTSTKNLGGCTLTVLVHPPFLPYIETKTTNNTANPGGIFGKLLFEVSKIMNFTPAYEWKVGRSDVLSFTEKHNLNLLVDMLPHSQSTEHKYRFTVGPVSRSFVVPPVKHIFRLTELMNSFDKGSWSCMFIIFFLLTIACIKDMKADISKLLLQSFGIFLGVGVGDLGDRKWFRYFLWAWLLPAYVLVQVYLANITETLSVPLPVRGVKTVDELTNSKVDIYCGEETKLMACSLGKSGHKLCRACRYISDEELYNKVWPNLLQSKMLNNSAIIFNTDMRFAYADVFNDLAVVSEETHLNQIISVRPGNDYIFELRRIVQTFRENGILEYFLRRFGKSKKKVQAKTSYGLEFQLLYTVAFCGWLTSFIVFVLEIIVHRLSRR